MLLISDLHLTDNEADKYRWQIFPWAAEYFRNTKDKNLIILGDLTDAKDHHSATLVNGIVSSLLNLRDLGMEIFILKGNHDYIDPDLPYFGFLNGYEYINYITRPKNFLIQGLVCQFLPHTRDPREDWKKQKAPHAALTFMHQSVIGSVTSNGYEMTEGLPPSYFKRFPGQVFSGDIHVPQVIGPVTYVGAPYSVRFNDNFRGRAIEISPSMVSGDDIMCQAWYPEIPGRCTLDINSVDAIDAPEGYQVKVRVHIADYGDWPTFMNDVIAKCKLDHLDLRSVQLVVEGKLPLRKRKKNYDVLPPEQIVKRFGKRKGLSTKKINVGQKIVLPMLLMMLGCAPEEPPPRPPDVYLGDGTPCWYVHELGYPNSLRLGEVKCDPTHKDKDKRPHL